MLGAIIGALVVLAAEGLTRPSLEPRQPTEASDDIEIVPSVQPNTASGVLLAWSPDGLPARTERVAESLPGVRAATTVVGGLEWITGSRSAEGTELDDPPGDLAIPWEIAFVDPSDYADFVAPSEKERILSLRPERALLAETETALRGQAEGLQITLRGARQLEVVGVVSDVGAAGYESLTTGRIPASWHGGDRFLLMRVGSSADRRLIEARIQSLLGPGGLLRIRAEGETPFLRYGDAVLPQLLVKKAFGEFAARPTVVGSIEMDPAWRKTNIVSKRLPILGSVTCHKTLFPQLRAALDEVISSGLAFAINPEQYAGCFSPRFIGRDPSGRLSHHSWGAAIDLNAGENATGTRPDQDPRLVEIFEDNGFTWGGRWLVPDGMHFEWVRFP